MVIMFWIMQHFILLLLLIAKITPSLAGYICPQTSASKNILGLEEVWWRWRKQTQGIDKTGEDGKGEKWWMKETTSIVADYR